MSDVTLLQGDCLERLKELDDNSVDSIVTDPPYFLVNNSGKGFMAKEWDGIIGLWKYLWLQPQFTRTVTSILRLCQVEPSKVEILSDTPSVMPSLKRDLLTEDEPIYLLTVTKREVLDVLSAELSSLALLLEPLLSNIDDNALFAIPLFSPGIEHQDAVLKAIKQSLKAGTCQDETLPLSSHEVLRIRSVIAAMISCSTDDLSIVATATSTETTKSIIQQERYSATILRPTNVAALIKPLTLSLYALLVTPSPRKIQSDLITNFLALTWRECLRVLKPGGHVLAFGGTRTYHYLANAVESVGFEIRDQIMWVYGSGFPKSHNVGKALDKIAGAERWEGWCTALKPAHEPVVLARKPFTQTVAANVLQYGTGALNIDGCRVYVQDKDAVAKVLRAIADDEPDEFEKVGYRIHADVAKQGRWPANLIHDGSDEVVALFPSNAGASGKDGKPFHTNYEQKDQPWKGSIHDRAPTNHGDSGSAARFFYCAKASKADRNEGLHSLVQVVVEYTVWDAKKETQEAREAKLLVAMEASPQRVTGVCGVESKNATEWSTVLFGNSTTESYQRVNRYITETATNSTTTSVILNWLTHLLTSDYTADANSETASGGNRAASANDSNTLTATMSEKMVSALGVKNVVSQTPLRISVSDGRNVHSTVKPTNLMRYLCRLVTPPGGTVLDPFTGSGSTGKAARLEGFKFIGIEREIDYIEIARARINAVTVTQDTSPDFTNEQAPSAYRVIYYRVTYPDSCASCNTHDAYTDFQHRPGDIVTDDSEELKCRHCHERTWAVFDEYNPQRSAPLFSAAEDS